MEKAAAARSQHVLHERIRQGVAVGRSLPPTARQRKVAARLAGKAEKRAAREAAGAEYQAGRGGGKFGGGKGKGKRLGSKRTQAVEAQWGNKAGQYKE